MMKRIEKIFMQRNHPFAWAETKCNFKENRYIEEEFFIEGTSNIYGRKENGEKTVLYADAPYCNRFLVRRPEKLEDFSGNIVLELMNSSYFIDLDRVWTLTYRHMMRKGDIYIGLTSKPSVLPALKKFDYKRYERLCWPNPREMTLPEWKQGNINYASSNETEDGLIWDMINDLAREVKNPDGFLKEFYRENNILILSGWSQSGGYMIRYLKDFQDISEKEKLFDGYFSCGSGSISTPDLNQDMGQTAFHIDRNLYEIRKPFIEIHTESENFRLGNEASRGENGNREDYKYRIYDIPGATHDSIRTMTEYYLNDNDVHKAGIVPVYPGKEPRGNDFPYELVFHRCLEYLYEWIREGKEPPVVEPIMVDEKGKNVKDECGNAVGGWRFPQIDLATRTYFPFCTPMKQEYKLEAELFGYVKALPEEYLVQSYGDLCSYENMIRKNAEEYVRKGLLLSEDMEECIQDAISKAKEDGLI